jgi:HAMP domain-containing protein
MSYTSAKNFGNEHQDWLNKIQFYKDDFIVLQNRLDEIVQKNNSKEAMVEVEHFQNLLILYKELFDELKHNVNQHMHKFNSTVDVHAGHVETTLIEEHDKMNDEVKGVEKVVNEMRQEFNKFLTKWM